MAAVIVEIADAVVDTLNDATLSQSFTAVRAYVPVYARQDTEGADELADLLVTVVPRSTTLAMLSRRDDDFDYVVDIGIQQRVEVTNAVVDARMLLAEEVLDLFRGKRLVLVYSDDPLCVAAANDPIYAPDHLDQHRVFTSVVSLTYRLARAR
jgi:hypothetical protein